MAKGKRKNKKIATPNPKSSLLKKQSPDNLLSGISRGSVNDDSDKISFNFRQLDESQGSSISEWETAGHLGQALRTLKDYSSRTMPDALGKKFKIYGGFPPKTDYNHPIHVPPDAKWASMHVNGMVCLGGHVVGSIFYVVFLDPDHRFYITELKRT